MRPKDILEPLTGGVNSVLPAWELAKGQLQRSRNMISQYGYLQKSKGTSRHTPTSVSATVGVPWVTRYYGKLADNTLTRKSFFFCNGTVYAVNDASGATTAVLSGLTLTSRPKSFITQVAGNSRMYILTGDDVPYYHEGDAGNNFYKSAITSQFAAGLEWVDKIWYLDKRSASVTFSQTLNPEQVTDSTVAGSVLVGNDLDAYNVGILVLLDTLFIWKSDSIWYIEGRTSSTFQARRINDRIGCVATHCIIPVQGKAIFPSHDGEIYSFNGSSLQKISTEIGFADRVNLDRLKYMTGTYHKGLVRISYAPSEQLDPTPPPSTLIETDEAIFPVDELNERGFPKWSFTRGANVASYAVCDQQGDHNFLLSGRSDIGAVMYMNRGENYDGVAMEVNALTRDFPIGSGGRNGRITDLVMLGVPKGAGTLDVETYLDGRNSQGTSDGMSQEGEVQSIGLINVSDQSRFHDRVRPAFGKRRGQTIAVGFTKRQLNFDTSLQAVQVNYRVKEHIRGQFVGG